MGSFFHHPDGWITITNTVIQKTHRMTIRYFQNHEPGYSLPGVSIGRIYIQEQKHSLLFKGSKETEMPLPWAEGNEYIRKINDYIIQPEPDPAILERQIAVATAQSNYLDLPVPFNGTKEEVSAFFSQLRAAENPDLLGLLENTITAILAIRTTIWDT